MTGAEMELAVLVAQGVITAGSAIYQAIVADEDPAELLERARAAGVALPVRTGPGGAWDADLDERLKRGGGDARPIGERETQPPLDPSKITLGGPPANPYPDASS